MRKVRMVGADGDMRIYVQWVRAVIVSERFGPLP